MPSELIYISGLETGITRKKGKHRFLYHRADGRRVTDKSEIARLDNLAVPPAYTDVILSPNPHTHLQAVGIDGRGRRQYVYHAEWRSERERAKFDSLADFGSHLPDLRERVDADLRKRRLTMDKALAAVVWMLDNLFIRVGNANYTAANGSFGLTTLRDRHVKIEGSCVRFRFIGKSGKQWNLVHSDRRIANVIRRLQELPGQQLFQYVCDDGGCRQISSQDVNAYIRDVTGNEFSSRQFRTWGATCLAAAALAPVEVAASKRAIAMQLNEAIDRVAARLVNTRSVCRSSYIHPAVFEDFRRGKLGEVLRLQGNNNARLLRWMDEEEIRVLRWLTKRARVGSQKERSTRRDISLER